ncbi:MAG: homocysteine S-methyltransferase family protein [Candidatus Lernaella stagnicola]|nr:homocysteine S-methyltransferase family protein [Candidatus Lernaella stagnicola]
MSTILNLPAGRAVIGDGAMGTELLRRGAAVNKPLSLLNLDKPEWVHEIHLAYAQAGSDLVITNTFGASDFTLAKRGFAGKARAVNEAAVRIARDAVGPNIIVLGGLAPAGLTVEPLRDEELSLVRAGFEEQVDALVAAGVDGLILESFFDLREALMATAVAVATGLPVVASMTFGIQEGEAVTLRGEFAADCARALTDAGAALVGANCTVTVNEMPIVAQALRRGSDLPLMMQPNGGQPTGIDARPGYEETPEHFAAGCRTLVEQGARVVGGCCGIGPSFIRELSRLMLGD